MDCLYEPAQRHLSREISIIADGIADNSNICRFERSSKSQASGNGFLGLEFQKLIKGSIPGTEYAAVHQIASVHCRLL
jgi:hypothetical protein